MKISSNKYNLSIAIAFVAALILPIYSWAHCDSLDGPVVQDARLALEKNDSAPILKWVQKKDESEIIAAFKQTVAVRSKGADAKLLADRFFFETLVRIHRQGEGEAFAGLKPAHSVDSGIANADKALQTGSGKELAKQMSSVVSTGIQKRFDNTIELKKHAGDSVDAGRKYVAAYVDYVHFVESIHRLNTQSAPRTHQESTSH